MSHLILILGVTVIAFPIWMTFVAAVVPGFTVGGFWTAFWAAIFIAVVSFITNRLIGRPVK